VVKSAQSRARQEEITMRLIYEGGQTVGPEPVGYYVYLWRHHGADRYVGKGVNGRWLAHAVPMPNDSNQRKYRYFRDHIAEMSCFIIAEGLSELEAFQREIEEIDHRGFAASGTGTLLNDRRGSSMGPRRSEGPRTAKEHVDAWRAQPLFPREAAIRFLSDVNPWGANVPGREFYKTVLAKRPATVGEMLDLAAVAGWRAVQAQGHLRWLYTRGDYVEIDGKRFWLSSAASP
jgi:hypothetical protein